MSTPEAEQGEHALPPEAESAAPRRKGLTPEQRRLLGTPRSLHQERSDIEPRDITTASSAEAPTQVAEAVDAATEIDINPTAPAAVQTLRERPCGTTLVTETKASRHNEMQRAFVILGLLLFVVLIFIAGRKFDRAKYLIKSRMDADELEGGPYKFPGLTPDELVEAAIVLEKQGDFQGAADRLIEGKRKDLSYQGILFRIGKSSYDRGDLNGADKALEKALAFGENVAVANHLRGLIAVRRHDLPAAERFFEAAAKAEPFVSDFFYFWGETLRLNQKPREAIRRYQQAAGRTPSTSDATLCRFKIRLARVEAAEAAAISAEVEMTRQAGPLSVDWLMTEAALQLQAGEIAKAAQLIVRARENGINGLFLTCAGDTVFLKAAAAYPEIAAVIAPSSLPQNQAE